MKRRKSITGTLRREGYSKSEADAIARRIRNKAKKQREAKSNPSGTTWVLLGVGVAALGVGVYFLLKPSTSSTTATTAAPVPASLPPGTDMHAAVTATRLMLIGHDAERTPAAAWLRQFQASVGLPATGILDPTTRVQLNKATDLARQLPATTILG